MRRAAPVAKLRGLWRGAFLRNAEVKTKEPGEVPERPKGLPC